MRSRSPPTDPGSSRAGSGRSSPRCGRARPRRSCTSSAFPTTLPPAAKRRTLRNCSPECTRTRRRHTSGWRWAGASRASRRASTACSISAGISLTPRACSAARRRRDDVQVLAQAVRATRSRASSRSTTRTARSSPAGGRRPSASRSSETSRSTARSPKPSGAFGDLPSDAARDGSSSSPVRASTRSRTCSRCSSASR